MTKLSEMPFKSIQVGMRFYHNNYGEQIVLDLDRNSFGPVIKFHNCDLYSGKMPEITDEERDIYELLARTTFPSGAEEWEFSGMLAHETMLAHGWRWFEVSCPHCGSIHYLIAAEPTGGQRQCLACGMVHLRPLQPSSSPPPMG